jgi:hypothetical protein
MPRILLFDNDPQFICEFWRELFLLLGTKINLTSTYHPQSNGGQEKFKKTLIEALRTYVSHRQDTPGQFLDAMLPDDVPLWQMNFEFGTPTWQNLTLTKSGMQYCSRQKMFN